MQLCLWGGFFLATVFYKHSTSETVEQLPLVGVGFQSFYLLFPVRTVYTSAFRSLMQGLSYLPSILF